MTIFEQTLADELAGMGIAHDTALLGQCSAYYQRVKEANRHQNLTRLTDEAAAAKQHFADAMVLVTAFDLPTGSRVIDIGTGAGFPGVPLKLLRPDIKLWLLDASGKKTGFIRQALEEMGVEATVLCARAEDTARTELRGSFDAVVSRAVAPLPMLLELTVPLLRTKGMLAAWKGESHAQELADASSALSALGCALTDRRNVGPGAILLIQKQKPTPDIYPRRFSKIKSQPL